MLLIILGFLCGTLLSFRFDFLILLPATLLGCALAVIGGVASGDTAGTTLMAMILITSALQFGYMAGIVGQWVLGFTRVLPQRWAEKPAAAPAEITDQVSAI